MTFRYWSEQYINYKSEIVGFARLQNIKTVIKIHLKLLSEKEASEIQKSDILNIIEEKSKTYAYKTVKDILCICKEIFYFAMENGEQCTNPAKYVKASGKPENKRDALSDVEMQSIKNSKNGKLKTAALIMLYAGLRRGEMLALDWSDIDFENHTISISKSVEFRNDTPIIKNSTKTRSGIRVVPIPNSIYDFLRENREIGLVCDYKGKPFHKSNWTKRWNEYEETLNFNRHITPHYLRHTYCTLLFRAGVPVQIAQKLLGHAKCSTTIDIYTHLSEKDIFEESFDRINNYLI
jgi:integrase